ncbi:MAG: M1 family metallopeptidase [Myxococcota bacterium]
MIQTLTMLTVLAAPPAGLQPKVRPYDAQHYKLEVRQGEGGAFTNTLTATLKATKAMPEIELDAYDLKVTSAKVDGEPAEFKEYYRPETRTGTLTLKPKQPIAAGKDAVVEIAYSVTAGTSNKGLFTATEPEVPNALPGYFTHLEPNYAQRFMPVNDTPADKATSEIFAIVDGRYQVVSNGRKEKDETFSEDGKNLRRVHWKQEQPHSPYLIALAIAQLEPYVVTDDIPATLWIPPGMKDRAFIANDVFRDLFNFQTRFTGTKFPWAKLDVVTVPRFYFGGMENTSAIFERTSLVVADHKNDQLARSRIAGLLSHEMAHQYFGDFVTPATWDEIWLSEGFATWLGDLAWDAYNDNDESEVRRAVGLTSRYFTEEDGPHAHPLIVKGIPAEDAFDATTYIKGANVLRMLELWVGPADMKKAIKAYLEKHGGKPVTTNDFFKAVFDETKKEKELKGFKDAWTTKKGYPIVFPDSSFSGGKLTVTIRQQPNHASEKGPFVFKLPIVIHRETEPSYTKEETIVVDKPEVKVTIDVPAAPQWINWNKNFGALAKIQPTAVSEEQWVDAARHDSDPVWRLLATWQLLGELGATQLKAETKPTDAALGAILDVLTKDPSPYVREAVLDRLANTRFRKLPSEFAAPLLTLAKRPEGLNEDPAGYIRVRNAAMGALGRVDNADGHKWLLEELGKRDIDVNYLEAYAAAAARIASPAALGQLRAALVTQKGRGAVYYRRAVGGLGAGSSIEVLPLIREVLKANPGNNELGRTATGGLWNNHELRETQEFASFVHDAVLDEKNVSEELRFLFLKMLDDVKYEHAKLVLAEIAAKSTSESIKGAAKRTLDTNFPSAPAPTPGKDPKKKK